MFAESFGMKAGIMEKLEPILKQKFWILLGLGIVMTITGWWMATGSMAATITTRKDEIKKAQGKIPSGEIPNDRWSSGLAAFNADQDRAVQAAARVLWERQRDSMTWPDTVAEFAWKNGYRGEIAIGGRENYRTAYGYAVRDVWNSVRPFNRLDGSGIVEFGADERALQQRTWGSSAPLSADMWDAQEDLWLQESILKSIARVNGGPNGDRLDATIHVIERFELHGGQPASKRQSKAASTGGGPGAKGGVSMSSPGGSHGGGGPGPGPGVAAGGTSGPGMGGLGGQQQALATADFDSSEEFGEEGSSGSSAGGPGSVSMSSPGGGHSGPGNGPGGPGATANATGAGARRYIDDEDALPFKTRGFYLSVIMDHRKVPDLIAELSSSEQSAWPIEILRVQIVRLHEDDVDGRGLGGSVPVRGGNLMGPGLRGNSSSSGPMPSSSPFGPGSAEFNSPFPTPGGIGKPPGVGATSAQAEAAAAAFENAMQDPSMAHVALCGVITLYKEVKPVALPPANTVPPAGTPVNPTAAPASGTAPAAASGVPGAEAVPATNAVPSTQGQPGVANPNGVQGASPKPATDAAGTTPPAGSTPAPDNGIPKTDAPENKTIDPAAPTQETKSPGASATGNN
jgi:hypothetical protein